MKTFTIILIIVAAIALGDHYTRKNQDTSIYTKTQLIEINR